MCRLVEAFSPWCGHCKSLAPKWQTLYEFYYTSDPLPASSDAVDSKSSLNSFTRYYDFKFAKLDCTAFGTACNDVKVTSYPSLILFKDGEEITRSTGDRDMKSLSEFIEEALETIRPGSRPANGLELPAVGADHAPTAKAPQPPDAKALKHAQGTDAKTPAKGDAPAKGEAPANAEVPGKGEAPAKGEASVKGGAPARGDGSAKSDASAKGGKATQNAGLQAAKDPKHSSIIHKPKIPARVPNPTGKSIEFTAEAFKHTVTRSLDGWFVKFYAPWCGHCQQLAPIWSSMAKELEGRLDIGEVNCDVEKKLCRSLRLSSYPTLVFFKGTDRIDYDGLRGLGDLISYGEVAAKASAPVADVTAADFQSLEKNNEVIFLYFYDHAATSEDVLALDRLPVHLTGRAQIVKTNDSELISRYKITSWPTLLVSRSGKPVRYPSLSPQDIRDVPRVVKWMQSNWLPLVSELTVANAREVIDGKLTVLGLLSRERSDEFVIAMRELKNAASEWMDKQEQAYKLERQELRDAKNLRIEEAEDHDDTRALNRAKAIKINMNEIPRKQVVFAWVDGQFWERWIKTTYGVNVRDGERVIINDEEVSDFMNWSSLFLLLTRPPAAPTILGHDGDWQSDCAVAHLDPRDAASDHLVAAQARAEANRLRLLPLLLLHQQGRRESPGAVAAAAYRLRRKHYVVHHLPRPQVGRILSARWKADTPSQRFAEWKGGLRVDADARGVLVSVLLQWSRCVCRSCGDYVMYIGKRNTRPFVTNRNTRAFVTNRECHAYRR